MPKTYTLILTEAAIQLIGTALGKQPYETVVAVVHDINMQLQRQMQEAQMAEAKANAPKAEVSVTEPKLPDAHAANSVAPPMPNGATA